MAVVEMILGTGVKVKSVGAWFALLLLLCLCVNSWGACYSTQQYADGPNQGDYGTPCGPNHGQMCSDCGMCTSGCGPVSYWTGSQYLYLSGGSIASNSQQFCSGSNNSSCSRNASCWYSFACTSQAEADSVACENDPSLPGCAVTKDTLLYACSESLVNGQAVATIYKLSCKATNGSVTECNGKQNVDISTDGQPVKQMQGTCAQNGIPNGVFGGSDVQDSTELPNGANADCFAITGSKCHMKDKVSGNTFTCDCDGSCQVAIQNLMAGSASCTNPYPRPTSSSDSLNLGSSGSGGGSSPSSSGSEGGSSPSSSPSDSTGDFEYDYNAVLEAIRANTQYTGSEVNRLNGKADQANDYLQQIANKDWNPTINVGGPTVHVAGDTNIINVQGDTARAGAEILRWLTDENYSIDTSGRVKWNNFTDSIRGWISNQLDTLDVDDSLTDMGDSLGTAVQGIHTAWGALKDSIGNSAIEDSIGRWQGMFLDNGTLTGSGSDNCPQVLLRQYSLSFPILGSTITVPFGNLGVYICSPVAGTGVNLWVLARTLLRAMVAITCMYWLYKAVLGIDERDGE